MLSYFVRYSKYLERYYESVNFWLYRKRALRVHACRAKRLWLQETLLDEMLKILPIGFRGLSSVLGMQSSVLKVCVRTFVRQSLVLEKARG